MARSRLGGKPSVRYFCLGPKFAAATAQKRTGRATVLGRVKATRVPRASLRLDLDPPCAPTLPLRRPPPAIQPSLHTVSHTSTASGWRSVSIRG